jgi:N-acetylglucosaminyldiphosphoundecaprenol N-acetyl-beta-D-mannosaminyltransferase
MRLLEFIPMSERAECERFDTKAIGLDSACIVGVKINDMPLSAFLEQIEDLLRKRSRSVITYINVHALNLAYELPWFRQFLNDSTIAFCDGYGVMLAARLAGVRINNRYTPPDCIRLLCACAARNSARVFFLGAEPGVAEHAAQAMRAAEPQLRIESAHGYFDKEPGSRETQAVIQQINAFGTDMLCVGFGMPAQEKWISGNRSAIGATLVMPVGAMFDFLAGTKQRAPRWMTDHGLEWLGRLFTEPGRLWQRYLVGLPLFFLRVIRHHWFKQRLPGT